MLFYRKQTILFRGKEEFGESYFSDLMVRRLTLWADRCNWNNDDGK